MNTDQKLRQIHLHLLAAAMLAEELREASEEEKVKDLANELVYQIERPIYNGLFDFLKEGVTDWGMVSEHEVLNLIHGPAY